MKHIYTSLDIGSDTIKIAVCELYQNKLNLLVSSSYKSKGIKKGLITDVELATSCIKEAIRETEDKLGLKIKRIITTIPSFNAEYSIVKGDIKINNEYSIVKNEDIIGVLENALKNQTFQSRELITMLPVDYSLDDKAFIKNPLNMRGNILGCRAILVTTPKKNVYSVIGILEKIGLEVVDISLNNIGDYYAFNSKKFEDKIGAIVNIGNDITNVSLYNKGVLVKSSIVNMGGSNIDRDISYMYKIGTTLARKLKTKFALAHTKNANVNDVIEVKNDSNDNFKINQYELSQIVSSRLEDILTEAKKEINLLTSKKIDYIIITGGSSNILDFEYIAKDVFGLDANIGNVKMLGLRDNSFSSCVGNIVYFISKLKLKNQDYSMISDDEFLQYTPSNNRRINTSDSMFGKIFGFFFVESDN